MQSLNATFFSQRNTPAHVAPWQAEACCSFTFVVGLFFSWSFSLHYSKESMHDSEVMFLLGSYKPVPVIQVLVVENTNGSCQIEILLLNI